MRPAPRTRAGGGPFPGTFPITFSVAPSISENYYAKLPEIMITSFCAKNVELLQHRMLADSLGCFF